MNDLKDGTFDIASLPVLAEEDGPSREPRFRDRGDLSETFFSITRELSKKYDIDKGVLVLRHDQDGKLAAISTWQRGFGRDGLALNLPTEASLLEKVAEDGRIYTEEFSGSFSGNFFERKLLLDDDTRSFVVQPLKSDGRVLGLMGFSSTQPCAFAMFEEGTVDRLADQLGALIQRKICY
ncbi:MAG TPA: GAF domain-containing protein [candidate division Zixibacteria bacterium]|nr:GAF domain-containing protein [candidate division Zixibacteria bacterium]